MLILTIKTDQPLAEVALFDGEKKIADCNWQAHRQLAETIHQKINELLEKHNQTLSTNKLGAIVCYKGPGSFTGLRIGLTVGNTLAYASDLPIVGETGDNWQQAGIARLLKGENEKTSLPEYGQEPNITQPRK